MTRLLVSVRSALEAEAALRGGAALIDVKEPAHGSLGRASDAAIAEVARVAAKRCPVSAALGELKDAEELPIESSLAYVKWGLAGAQEDWRHRLRQGMQRLTTCRAVAVGYADARRAHAPTPDEVCSFAIENAAGAFLLDTWRKDGSTLLDWLPQEEIARLRQRCRAAAVPMALAGSLGIREIETLLPLRPEWFAVRGAVCQGRQRGAAMDEGKVRQLAALLREKSCG
jgi:uncharacterized protein (UPF0264 family)